MPRSVFVPVVSFLAWTLFVWVGRVRNALGDPELSGSERVGPLLLAASFAVPALLLAIVLFASARSSSGVGPVLRGGVLALAAWTCGVWVVRIADIASEVTGASASWWCTRCWRSSRSVLRSWPPDRCARLLCGGARHPLR